MAPDAGVQRCGFCELGVYLPDASEHPCCVMAKSRGERECGGCETFRRRWQRGETCPHVTGKDRACCALPNGRSGK